MSFDRRFDPLGLSELDSAFGPDSAFPDAPVLPGASHGQAQAQQAFADMKQLFVEAVQDLAHRKAAWLRAQVRAAEDPVDLWLLRGSLLAALREDEAGTRRLRAALYRSLDRTFPEMFGSARATVARRV